jgi:hypothetical protein
VCEMVMNDDSEMRTRRSDVTMSTPDYQSQVILWRFSSPK